MDKTININLGGSLFRIDEEAFHILRNYLQAVNARLRNTAGGAEAVDDIESRIAEIFSSQRGNAGVVTRENIEAMIAIIGKPEDFDLDDPDVTIPESSGDTKKLYRNPDDTIISGVCGGLGVYFNTDPVLFRILFVAFSLLFFAGVILYLGMWIVIPAANSPAKKKEMYGRMYNSMINRAGMRDFRPVYEPSKFSIAVNGFFRGIGKIIFIFFRIILITLGASFILAGFLTILTFVMVFIFKIPGALSIEGVRFDVGYFPGIINYIVKPSLVPWIFILSSLIIILPCIAFIYWGIRMIFWFRVRDGFLNLGGLVLWIMCIAALSIILFSEGVSFAESQRVIARTYLKKNPEALYVVAGKKIDDISVDKEYTLPDGDFSNVFLVDSAENLYIKPNLRLRVSDSDSSLIEVRKRSSGSTKREAERKAESLAYSWSASHDTVYLDEYFKIPAGSRWSGDFVDIRLVLPENTILYFDKPSAGLFSRYIEISAKRNEEEHYGVDYDTESWELGGKYWKFTSDGLVPVKSGSATTK